MKVKQVVMVSIVFAVVCPLISNGVLIAYDPFSNADVGAGENDKSNGVYNAGTQFRDFTSDNNADVEGSPILGWSAAYLWVGNSGSDAGTNDKIIGPTDLGGLSFGDNVVQGGNVQLRGRPNVAPNTSNTVSYARRQMDSYTGQNIWLVRKEWL